MLQGHHMFSLLLLVGYIQLTSGEVYYITPSPSSPCPEQPCLTLSQILANASSIFNSNTTLLFLPENHSLHSDLVIGNIPQLNLLGLSESSLESATISCPRSAKIQIDNVDRVYFGQLNFIGCSENEINSVCHFIVNGSTFNGQHNTTGTALELSHTNATVVNSSFIFNTYGSYRGPIELPGLLQQQNDFQNSIHARVGGALIISSSNVSVTDCRFEGNSAEMGGAIFTEGISHIKLTNSSFVNNQAFSLTNTCFGGAIFCGADNLTATTSAGHPLGGNNMCMVINSTFVNNTAVYGGGAIAALSGSIFVRKSKILMNSATRGGAMMIYKSSLAIDDSHFELNSAIQRGNSEAKFIQGGAILARNSSSITISRSAFCKNSASTSGGVIDTSTRCNLIIMQSQFSNNWANVGGGVIVVNYLSTVSISESMFENNTAEIIGGVAFINKGSVLNVATTRFVDNKSYYGGVLLLQNNATTHMSDSQFYNNSAFTGGVFGAFYESQISLNHCVFINNTANVSGGVGVAQSSMISMTESSVVNSSAPSGGVIDASDSSVRIKSSKFDNCKARGGGVLLLEARCKLVVQDSEFQRNVAFVGGVMFLNNSCYGSVNTSRFKFNDAVKGGVAFMKMDIRALFNNCEFGHNAALKNGGVFKMNLHCEIHLVKTTFIKNHAEIGGAIDFGVNDTRLAIIEESVFTKNTAKAYGGTLCIFMATRLVFKDTQIFESHSDTRGAVLISGSNVSFEGIVTFSGNYGSMYAANSALYFKGSTTFVNNVLLQDTPNVTDRILLFNQAAAITVYRTDIYIKGFTAFINNSGDNGGAIHTVDSNVYISESVLLTNNTATYNGGGLYLYQSRLQCRDDCSLNIIGNQALHSGGGICAVSSIVEVVRTRGTGNYLPILSIHNNKARMGGGMHLEANAKLYVLKVVAIDESFDFSSVEFVGNSAEYGGAISVDDITSVGVCNSDPNHAATLKQQHAENTECFMQVFNMYQLYVRHTNATLTFSNNSARHAGSALFGGLLDRCIASSYAEIYFYEHGTINMDSLHYGAPYFKNVSNILLDSVSSYPVKVCFCIDGKPNCNYTSLTKHVRKGETFSVDLVAVDQVDHIISYTTIHSYLTYTESGLGEGQLIQTTRKSCTKLTYSITSVREHEQLVIYAEGPCRNSTMSRKSIDVQFDPCTCPIGFQQSDKNTDCVCTCDTELLPYISDCNATEETVIKRTDAWISYHTVTALNSSGYLIHDHCPLDYCLSSNSDNKVSINLNQINGSDAQCAYNRMGTLCGTCRPGFSLSLGSSKCLSCPHWHAKVPTIVAGTILSGILLVVLLLVLNLTVAVGTLNGVIFYANIVASNFSTFLPFSLPNFITVFIAWLNLDIGLNTCFFEKLDSFWKLWMDIFFSAYLIGLVALVIVFSERSTKFARLVGRKNPVATLATLILFSYTKLLRTVILSLSFAILKYPDNSTRLVWLPDGTVQYLSGKHIALFIAGLFILILGAVYTTVLFLWQWILLYQHKTIFKWARDQRLKDFLDPYHAPYIYKYRYWTGLLLFIRAVLYIIAAVNVSNDPGINLLAVGCVMFGIVVLKSCLKTNKVYKSWPIDLLDMISYLNLTFVCLVNFYLLLIGAKSGERIVAYISGSITLMLFVIILFYHFIFELILKSRIWNTLKRKWTDSSRTPQTDLDSCSEMDNDQASLIEPTFTEIECPPQGEIPLSALVKDDTS